ncbi:uncharacterized protein L969DRAFT_84877 [Mixia osmundae IAM 14324]|uniref:uncharacterized protein n=1 Tax=Mixia osmundae (strain CBS 9802 / IAM 14324 / JCM 22182 / KY 12970) TaxID=764103 RepID=UPI0004A54DC3|nr:uncharacterized protein L969DRAFT_84877 [Mixia osmundae IAM 14324]KEI41146.1 hypothetical protein L969DRAFT_84877 [Mixia osmundae IAM 14324]
MFKGLLAITLAATGALAQQWPNGNTGDFEIFLGGKALCGALYLRNGQGKSETYDVEVGQAIVKVRYPLAGLCNGPTDESDAQFRLTVGERIKILSNIGGVDLVDSGYDANTGKWTVTTNTNAPISGTNIVAACGCNATMTLAFDVPLRGGRTSERLP